MPETAPQTAPESGTETGSTARHRPASRLPSQLLPRLAFAGLCLFGLTFLAALIDLRFLPGDEGIAAMGAWRIAQGQVPHRDFFEIFPPFSFLPTALLFRILGPGFLAERLLTAIYAVLLVFLSERLLARFTTDLVSRALVVAFLIPCGVLAWTLPSHHWVVDLLQIGALLTLLTALESRRPFVWATAGGALAALGCFTLQDQGAYLVTGLALLFLPWIRPADRRRSILVGVAAGGLGVAAAFALYLLPRVSLRELLYQWVVFPATHYKELPGNQVGLGALISQIGSAQWLAQVRADPLYHLAFSGLSLFLFALPWITLAVVTWATVRRWRERAVLGLLAAGCLAFLGASLHRFALINLIWAAPLPLVATGWALARSATSPAAWQRWSGRAAASLLIACCLAYGGSILRFARGGSLVEVTGTAGSLRTPPGAPEAIMIPAVEAVEALVPPGAPLLTTGYYPLVNFWTLRPNPTRFSYFTFHTPEQGEEIVAAVRATPGAYVLVFQSHETGSSPGQHFLRHYRPVWRHPTAVLLAPLEDVGDL